MAPSKAPTSWEDEESGSSAPSSPPLIARRSKFDDEEEDDVLDSWDAGEDSDVEREKAKKAAEAKAKADAAAKENHKTKSQRIEEHRQAKLRQRMLEDDESDDEDVDEATRRARAKESEKESDLQHAQDLFDGIGINKNRSAARAVTIQEGNDPSSAVDLSKLSVFNPKTAPEFTKLRETLVPLLTANAKKPQYALFLPEFAKQISRELSSDQIKKISSALTTLSNEKLKEEKAADKGGKKSKASKTKATLSGVDKPTSRADTGAYDDGLEDDDFM